MHIEVDHLSLIDDKLSSLPLRAGRQCRLSAAHELDNNISSVQSRCQCRFAVFGSGIQRAVGTWLKSGYRSGASLSFSRSRDTTCNTEHICSCPRHCRWFAVVSSPNNAAKGIETCSTPGDLDEPHNNGAHLCHINVSAIAPISTMKT